MKFSGANFLLRIPLIFKRAKVNSIALLVVVILLVCVFLYFNESNKIRMKEYEVSMGQTDSNFMLDTIRVVISHDYAGDFQLNSKFSDDVARRFENDPISILYYKLSGSNPTYDGDNATKMVLDSATVQSVDKTMSGWIPKYINVHNTICLKTHMRKNLPDYGVFRWQESDVEKKILYMSSSAYGEMSGKERGVYVDHICSLHLFDEYGECDWSAARQSNVAFSFEGFTPQLRRRSGLPFGNANQSSIFVKNLSLLPAKYKELRIEYLTAMAFEAVSPEPDKRTATSIVYNTPEKIEEIAAGGAYIHARSLSNGNKMEMHNFILATLIGFLLSLVVELIYKIAEQNYSYNRRLKDVEVREPEPEE